MRKETHKILGDSSIRIGNTCVRVPVINGHSIAINVEFETPLTVEDGLLTSSLKLRRKAVYERLRDRFEALYV